MRILIAGSRNYPRIDQVVKFVCNLPTNDSVMVISGHAQGVDRCAEAVAQDRGISLLIIPANWKKYGKAAGAIRNSEMVDKAHMVVVFWDGESRGSLDTIKKAKDKKKPLVVFTPEVRKNMVGVVASLIGAYNPGILDIIPSTSKGVDIYHGESKENKRTDEVVQSILQMERQCPHSETEDKVGARGGSDRLDTSAASSGAKSVARDSGFGPDRERHPGTQNTTAFYYGKKGSGFVGS